MKIIHSANSSCWIVSLNPLPSRSPATRVVPVVGIWTQQSFWRICFPNPSHDQSTTAGCLIKSIYGKQSPLFLRQNPFEVSQTFCLLWDFCLSPGISYLLSSMFSILVITGWCVGGISWSPNGKNYSQTSRWVRMCTHCVRTALGFLNACVNRGFTAEILIGLQIHVCNLMVFKVSLGLLRKMPMLQLGRAVETVFLISKYRDFSQMHLNVTNV